MPNSFYRYPDLDGDGGGAKSMAVNGSITPQTFKLTTRNDEKRLEIARMMLVIEDVGAMDPDGFGAGAALGNGIELAIYNVDGDTVRQDLTDGVPITSNSNWGHLAFDVEYDDYGTPTDTFLRVRWNFLGSGAPLLIGPDAYLGIKVQDDLTGLVEFLCQFQGTIIN